MAKTHSSEQPTHQAHPFHLVDPSPWPILMALALGVFAWGALRFMHHQGMLLMMVGLLLVLAAMAAWFRDVLREGKQHHNPIVQIGLRYGMTLFIASEVMFFAAFFWAFFDNALYPKEGIGFLWPPATIKTFDPFHLPLLNTLILLLSGTTVTWAHHALLEGKNRSVIYGLALTVALGLCFTGVQAYEYAHAAFGLKDTVYASTFYLATGFHGFHVLVGTIFLAVNLWRATQGTLTEKHHIGFESAAWYWHFVDVIWLFLFICVYWWGGPTAIVE